MKSWEMGWILHDAYDAWGINSLAFRWVWSLAAECSPPDSRKMRTLVLVFGWMKDRAMQSYLFSLS